MITVDEALELVREQTHVLPAERAPIVDAVGLVLGEDVTSQTNCPPFDKAQMDGYAVASNGKESVRSVIGTAAAGDVPRQVVTADTAVRIMTGAPIPQGADAVVAFEQVEQIDEQQIRLDTSVICPGSHVLPLGACLRKGQVALSIGTPLGAAQIGLVAESGHQHVAAIPRPGIAILATGNELVPLGTPIESSQIRNTNGPMLAAAATVAGAVSDDRGIAPDQRDDLCEMIASTLSYDVVALCGGVSRGDFDLVPEVLAELGVTQVFHRVALRPGKPLWFGIYERPASGKTLVFGLPGNPVSSYVCFELFVRPALAQLAGRSFQGLPRGVGRLATDYEPSGRREAFLPARIDRQGHVDLLPWRGSADLTALGQADVLANLPGGGRSVPAGTEIQCLRMPVA